MVGRHSRRFETRVDISNQHIVRELLQFERGVDGMVIWRRITFILVMVFHTPDGTEGILSNCVRPGYFPKPVNLFGVYRDGENAEWCSSQGMGS
jgi:hypothetical protein